MAVENNQNSQLEKKHKIRIIIIVIFILILFYIGYLLIQFGSNPLITIFLLFFLFLVLIGLFLRHKGERLYSRMFSDKKPRSSNNRQTRERSVKIERQISQLQPRIYKPINLDSSYHKPLISKCEYCGNILPNFVKKKCPFCNNQLQR